MQTNVAAVALDRNLGRSLLSPKEDPPRESISAFKVWNDWDEERSSLPNNGYHPAYQDLLKSRLLSQSNASKGPAFWESSNFSTATHQRSLFTPLTKYINIRSVRDLFLVFLCVCVCMCFSCNRPWCHMTAQCTKRFLAQRLSRVWPQQDARFSRFN